MRLQDKVVVVTRAAQGIGEAYARAIAAEGAAVVVADLNVEAGEQVAKEIDQRLAGLPEAKTPAEKAAAKTCSRCTCPAAASPRQASRATSRSFKQPNLTPSASVASTLSSPAGLTERSPLIASATIRFPVRSNTIPSGRPCVFAWTAITRSRSR